MSAQPLRRPPRPLRVAAACCALLAVLGLLAGCDTTGGSGGLTGPAGGTAGPATAPSGTTEVRVATSPEKFQLFTDLAAEFNAKRVDAGGKPAYVVVQKTSSGVGADLMVQDWPETDDQRRPTVWSPAASAWGQIVNERRAQSGKPAIVSNFDPIMLTPLVIAMPKPMAEALGWPNAAIGWGDLLRLAQDPNGWGAVGHPEWGPFRLGKTDPNVSTSGLNATIAQAYAGAGKQRDLTVADLDSPQVGAFLQGVESSIVHYGDTTLTFLDNLYRADQRSAALAYISAVAVEEKSVIDYNRGDPAGTGTAQAPPKIPLVAVYPKEGTLFSDNPFYVVDAPWVSPAQKTAADEFGTYVIGRRESQEQVLKAGFRPSDPNVALGEPITPANGVDPKQPQTVLPVPPGPVLAKTLDVWKTTRKTARVLMVLDVSGSMGDAAGPNGQTKLDLAKQAVLESLGQFADRDEVGLWIFSTEQSGSQAWRELAPVAPMAQNRAKITQYVRGLSPDGGTGLYNTTIAAVDAMQKQLQRDRITAVLLLTDGRNEDPTNDDLNATIARIGGKEGSKVRVFAVAYGADASIPELTKIAQATDGAVYQSKNPADINRVLRNVVANF